MTKTSFGDQLQHMWQTRPTRLPQQGPIAGVAAGFAHRYRVDPVLVRVAFVVSTIFGGAGVVLYLLGWLLFPQPDSRVSAAEALTGKGDGSQSQAKTIALIVALAIAVSTMGPMGAGMGGSGVIALALMLAGWWMLHMRNPEPPPLSHGAVSSAEASTMTGTGYPGTVFPSTTSEPFAANAYGPYTPYTKLPDRYIPDTPADGSPTVGLGKDDPSGNSAARSQRDVPAEVDSSRAESGPADAEPAKPNLAKTEAPASTRTGAGLAASDTAVADGDTAGPSTGTDRPTATPTDNSGLAGTGGPDRGAPTTRIDLDKTGTAGFAPTAFAGRTPPSWDPLGVAPLAWDLPAPAPARTPVRPAPPKPRSRFTPVVLGLAVLAAAGAGAAAVAGAEWMTPARIAAVALAVIGLGLVFGAFLRRGHGLLVAIAPVAGFVVLASLIGPVDWEGATMGDRNWTPATIADLRPQYTVTMGSGTLDLRGLSLTEDRTVGVSVQMGEARVLLPESMTVRTECSVNMGEAHCPDGVTGPGGDAPVLNLNVQVRAGQAEVTRG
ncbi:PspC domain-containing protein [Nocardia brevicatena]|uniref:PspC domain-containing protein n=1 Tax=Nocardia brevicatena TaxID=37327 RepID=UPI0002D90783|nr:PspC domain-containing protein [Nocardia brevicatena]